MVSERIKKINKHLQRTVSDILLTSVDIPAGVLITVARTETSPNLKHSTIWLYIAPTKRVQETLDHLKPQMYDIQGELNRAIHMRPLPRIVFKHDNGLDHADIINQRLHEIEAESKQ